MKYTYDVCGKMIEAYVWEEMERGETSRKKIEVTPYYDGNPGRKAKKDLEVDYSNGEVFFKWNGERVYIKDFVYKPVDTIISMFKNNQFVSVEDFVACMRKDSNFAIEKIVETSSYMKTIIGPSMPDSRKLLFVPISQRWTPRDWGYKVSLEAIDPLTTMRIHDTLYTSDLMSLIASGIYKLVNKSNYDPNKAEEAPEKKKKNGIFARIFSRFATN